MPEGAQSAGTPFVLKVLATVVVAAPLTILIGVVLVMCGVPTETTESAAVILGVVGGVALGWRRPRWVLDMVARALSHW